MRQISEAERKLNAKERYDEDSLLGLNGYAPQPHCYICGEERYDLELVDIGNGKLRPICKDCRREA